MVITSKMEHNRSFRLFHLKISTFLHLFLMNLRKKLKKYCFFQNAQKKVCKNLEILKPWKKIKISSMNVRKANVYKLYPVLSKAVTKS